MYFLLSPAKNLNETKSLPDFIGQKFGVNLTQPALMENTCDLVAVLKQLEPTELMALMGISDKLAQTNAMRYQNWAWDTNKPFLLENARPALYLFDGDVYTGLDAYGLNEAGVAYVNEHLGILSGLYGLLKPLDLILPYRLEMGTKLVIQTKNYSAQSLYQYWGDSITELLQHRMQAANDTVLINLASQEYFKAINANQLETTQDNTDITIITPRFEENKDGVYKVISFYAKKARGLMVKYAADNQITVLDDLKKFDLDGYQFVEDASTEYEWVFRRGSV